MEKNVSSLKVLNIILCAILLITFVLVVGVRLDVNAEEICSENSEVLPSLKVINNYLKLPVSETKVKTNKVAKQEKEIVYDLDYYIDQNKDEIAFYANVFDYNYDDIIYNLKTRETENPIFLSTNIGYLKDENGNLINYSSFEYGLIEYFYDLMNSNQVTRHSHYVPYTGSADYVEKLIIHFSSLYPNVDATTLLSIGAAESGYYEVKYMLSYNNIYGGMSSSGLVRHNNIELGVLSYVRMMSRNYYGKGLDTISEIGYVYCPSYENGYKAASSHWISLVSRAINKYEAYDKNVTFNELINKEEIA
jgi:hypothetical protein